MRIVVTGNNVKAILEFRELAALLGRKGWHAEAHRGMIDAGRRTKTQVQRSVFQQMALKGGTYTSHVVAHTRGISRKKLEYRIFSYRGGQKVEWYKGLRALSSGGEAIKRFNQGREFGDAGTVMSSVWNVARVFKRSFTYSGGWFALRPGRSMKAPRIFWTFGAKEDQPRDARGRFAASDTRYGRIRRLFGPSLSKEIPQGDSLDTFQTVAPVMMEKHIGKRLTKLMRY